jgi:hypothetical protein
VKECPHCGGQVEDVATVCRHCVAVLDPAARAERDAGRLGSDGRGAGHEPQDPAFGPIPLSGSGIAGAATAGLRLVTTGLLLRRRRRRQSDA